jgi:multidrug resistance efflux pump
MSAVIDKSRPQTGEGKRGIARDLDPAGRIAPRQRWRILPLAITGVAVALAAVLGQTMWTTYMTAPWTRDGTVRAYVVTMAPEVARRIIALPLADNQLVQKGDPLMVIDPSNYAIAVRLNEAALQQAQATMRNARVRQGAGRNLPLSRLRSRSSRPMKLSG